MQTLAVPQLWICFTDPIDILSFKNRKREILKINFAERPFANQQWKPQLQIEGQTQNIIL